MSAMFHPVELNDSEPVVVYAKEYLQKVSDLINSTDKRLGSFAFIICFPPVLLIPINNRHTPAAYKLIATGQEVPVFDQWEGKIARGNENN